MLNPRKYVDWTTYYGAFHATLSHCKLFDLATTTSVPAELLDHTWSVNLVR